MIRTGLQLLRPGEPVMELQQAACRTVAKCWQALFDMHNADFFGMRPTAAALIAIAAVATPCAAHEGETARFMNAPATAVVWQLKLAVQFELKLRLPEGRGLARSLIDAGVDQRDAATA